MVPTTEVYWQPSGRDVIGDLRMEQVNRSGQWSRSIDVAERMKSL